MLTGNNTFTGPATVIGGTLELSGGNAIGDTTAVIVNVAGTSVDSTSGTLQVDTAETIGSLAGDGGTVVLDANLTTGNDNTSTAYFWNDYRRRRADQDRYRHILGLGAQRL